MINYGYVDSDFAFWYEDASVNARQPDIHLNFWVGYKNEKACIDIGIRFYQGMRIRQYYIYVPFGVVLSDIEDLFETFKYKEVAEGIFNKNCNISINAPEDNIELSYDGGKEKILPLIKLRITSTRCGQGSILCLDLESVKTIISNDNIYFRWRLPCPILSNIIKKSILHGFSIDSPYIMSNYRYFFKINEIRSLPSDVKDKINITSKYYNSIVIILVNSNKIDINTSNCYKIRILEEDLFKKYKPKDYMDPSSNVYQWHVINNSSGSCSFIIEANARRINWISVLIYFLIILMTSLLANGIFECLKNNLKLGCK